MNSFGSREQQPIEGCRPFAGGFADIQGEKIKKPVAEFGGERRQWPGLWLPLGSTFSSGGPLGAFARREPWRRDPDVILGAGKGFSVRGSSTINSRETAA